MSRDLLPPPSLARPARASGRRVTPTKRYCALRRGRECAAAALRGRYRLGATTRRIMRTLIGFYNIAGRTTLSVVLLRVFEVCVPMHIHRPPGCLLIVCELSNEKKGFRPGRILAMSLPTPPFRPSDDELTTHQHVKPNKVAKIAPKSQINRCAWWRPRYGGGRRGSMEGHFMEMP